MIIEYAVVARRMDHDPSSAAEFIIRVVGHDSVGQWNNYPLNDSLWYCVPAPHFSGALPAPWVEGFEGHSELVSSSCSYCYKPWTRVALNLNDYVGDSIRIEFFTSDCIYNADPLYAYIAGDYQPMQLFSSGCASGETEAIDTLRAPFGMARYQWSRSATGAVDIYDSASLSVAQFVPVVPLAGEDDTSEIYLPTVNDFVAVAGGNMHDTLPEQTFRCRLTSALDPAKPVFADLFINVKHLKPVARYVSQQKPCSHDIGLRSTSFSFDTNHYGIVDSLTRWVFYNNATFDGIPLDTLYGDSVNYSYQETGVKGATLSLFTPQAGCYTVARIPFVIPDDADAQLSLRRQGECEYDSVTLVDASCPTTVSRTWIINDTTLTGSDARDSMTLAFDTLYNSVSLIVTNRFGCADTATQLFSVYPQPALQMAGNPYVCAGEATDIEATSSVEGCSYRWYAQFGDPEARLLGEGSRLAVAPDSSETDYYVRVETAQGCVSWDSIHVVVIKAAISVAPSPDICPGDTVVLRARGAYSYAWESTPYDSLLAPQTFSDTVVVAPTTTTTYTLRGYPLPTVACNPTEARQTITVVPYPVPSVAVEPPYIDEDNPEVVFTDLSEYRGSTSWLINGVAAFSGSPVTHRFENLYDTSLSVTMQSYNPLGCMSDTTFTLPVHQFAIWVPNVFTPGMEDNGKFALHSLNELEDFSIYIFDRRGDLVFSSSDPRFAWDGTHDGCPCPQGTYTYRYRYRRAGSPNFHTDVGTVTLLR